LALAPLATERVAAQNGGQAMSGMKMADMNLASMYLMGLATGTSENPMAWPMPMTMTYFGEWNASFMGMGFLSDVQQTGPRGGDKLYSTNWMMASAEHRAGAEGAFEAGIMLSLEPATITNRSYPLLFQTGETAYGVALVDAQHPHNFIMAAGFHYVRRIAEDAMLDLYVAPVGDPALGPVAFPHRASAAELPEAPISHHWQDSTHIADDVLTAGIRYGKIKLEASGFHGAEPGENRWVVQQGSLDSWSSRLWFFPSKDWAAQASFGRLTRPEALEPGDQTRATASLAYSRPMREGNWSSTLAWGRIHSTATYRNLNSYLAESVVPVTRRNLLTGRFELVDKDDLLSDEPQLEAQVDSIYGSTFRIGAYTLGYTRNIDLFRYLETGIGVNFTAYSLPAAIKPYYGGRPAGGNVFVRIRLRPPR
jgi:hypothetical protein